MSDDPPDLLQYYRSCCTEDLLAIRRRLLARGGAPDAQSRDAIEMRLRAISSALNERGETPPAAD